MKRRLFAILLAMTMAAGMGVTAGAETTPAYTDNSTVSFTKEYKLTNVGTVSPEEEFEFTITRDSVSKAEKTVTAVNMPLPTIGSVSYEAGEAGSSAMSKQIAVTLPEYTSVGVYKYKIREKDGGTAGVTYRNKDILLVVTVIQGENDKIRVAGVHTEELKDSGSEKMDKFDNIYSAGDLDIRQTVTGNMADTNREFEVKVKFTAPAGDTIREPIRYTEDGTEKQITAAQLADGSEEVTVRLKHDETIPFKNIPYGVTYQIVETDCTGDGYSEPEYDDDDTSAETSGLIDDPKDTVIIHVEKGVNLDTGIFSSNMPYTVMAGIAVCGTVLLAAGRRRREEQ